MSYWHCAQRVMRVSQYRRLSPLSVIIKDQAIALATRNRLKLRRPCWVAVRRVSSSLQLLPTLSGTNGLRCEPGGHSSIKVATGSRWSTRQQGLASRQMSLGLRVATLQRRDESLATRHLYRKVLSSVLSANNVLPTTAERGSRGSYCR